MRNEAMACAEEFSRTQRTEQWGIVPYVHYFIKPSSLEVLGTNTVLWQP